MLVESPLLLESPLFPAESLAGAIVPGLISSRAERLLRLADVTWLGTELLPWLIMCLLLPRLVAAALCSLALSPLELSPLELLPLELTPLELPDVLRPVPCEPLSACCRDAAESTLPSHPPIKFKPACCCCW